MEEAFKPSDPIGDSDAPDSPAIDEKGSADEAAALDYTCTFGGKSYGAGSRICWGGKIHECTKDGWLNIGTKC